MIFLLILLTQAVQRVKGCVNGSFVSTADISYNIYCDTDWPYNDLNHTADTDLSTCIDLCDSWNRQQVPALCIGVAVVLPGPSFSGCYLKSAMVGSGIKESWSVDSAKRNNVRAAPKESLIVHRPLLGQLPWPPLLSHLLRLPLRHPEIRSKQRALPHRAMAALVAARSVAL